MAQEVKFVAPASLNTHMRVADAMAAVVRISKQPFDRRHRALDTGDGVHVWLQPLGAVVAAHRNHTLAINVFPALKDGDFLSRSLTFQADTKNNEGQLIHLPHADAGE